MQIFSFAITNDDVALELTEAYVLQLFIADPSRRDVTIGNTALNLYGSSIILIKDEDSKW